MKKLSEIELHDGNLLGFHLNPESQTVTIDIEYYSGTESGDRGKARINFTGVTQVNQILDLDLMKKHAVFGNIVQWVVGEKPKVTHLYLARGLISITSKTVELVEVV